jgi:two-component system cell cycle response regulator DivK
MKEGSMMILIAEDDPSSRELLVEVLEGWGYGVVQAANGAEVLEQLCQATPDLILLDLQMPVLDGFAALERIRRNPTYDDIPVAALTACAMREDRERVLQAGFCAHIAKPIRLDSLREAVERCFRAPRENAADVRNEQPAQGSAATRHPDRARII